MTSVVGKQKVRYRLRLAPTFHEAVSKKHNRIKLPGTTSTEFWNSPPSQSPTTLHHPLEIAASLHAPHA